MADNLQPIHLPLSSGYKKELNASRQCPHLHRSFHHLPCRSTAIDDRPWRSRHSAPRTHDELCVSSPLPNEPARWRKSTERARAEPPDAAAFTSRPRPPLPHARPSVRTTMSSSPFSTFFRPKPHTGAPPDQLRRDPLMASPPLITPLATPRRIAPNRPSENQWPGLHTFVIPSFGPPWTVNQHPYPDPWHM